MITKTNFGSGAAINFFCTKIENAPFFFNSYFSSQMIDDVRKNWDKLLLVFVHGFRGSDASFKVIKEEI